MKRYTNLALAGLLILAAASGLVLQGLGTGWGRAAAVLHGVLGMSFLLLAPWKFRIARSGLRRRNRGAVWSLALAAAAAVTIGSGLVQMTGKAARIGPLGMMQIHIGAAVAAVVLAVWHYRRHPVRPRSADLTRRSLIRSASLAAGAGALLAGWETAVGALGWPGGERRFTGSHERGSMNPAAMPVTQWFLDAVPRLDRTELTVQGRLLGPEELAALPREAVTATLDCTSGWYSTQEWSGVRLDRLLGGPGAASVEVRSVTGYTRRFPARDADRLWLVFEMGGAPLSSGHGFPARIAAPGRRGFWWVKWVESIEDSHVPAWLQLPFPPT